VKRSQLGVNTASLAGLTLEETLEEAAKAGFKAVEMLAFEGMSHRAGPLAGFFFDEMQPARRKKIAKLLEPFRLRAVHLDFAHAPLLTYNRRIEKTVLELMREGIRGAEFFGAETAVLHLNAPLNSDGTDLGEHRGRAIDVLRRLADYAAGRSVRLGLETMFPRSIAEFAALVRDVDHEALGATLDVGHVVQAAELDDLRKRPPTKKFIRRLNEIECELIGLLGSKLYHVHLHGLDAETLRDHCHPDTGLPDFAKIFAALDEIRYEGMLSFELEMKPVKRAVRRARKHVARLLDEG